MADYVVVTIFVNPRQFGPGEDFASYPRALEADAALLERQNVDLMWAPNADTLYPSGYATTVSVAGLSDTLCGAARRGHFDGVATVVTKLFALIRPEVAVFGEKDWQQLAIIRRLSDDLNMGVAVFGCPIVREPDGLALSSRNTYLSPSERARATALRQVLQWAASQISAGSEVDATLAAGRERLLNAEFGSVDYLTLTDEASLQPLDKPTPHARLFVAAWLGKTRLIDNLSLGAS